MTIVPEDHSCQSAPETQPIPLPSLHLITIHAAVAEILEESSACIFLNKLMNLYMEKVDGTLLDLQYWSKLEVMVVLKDKCKA